MGLRGSLRYPCSGPRPLHSLRLRLRNTVTQMPEIMPASHPLSRTCLLLARDSLTYGAIVCATSSCLVTSSPDYTPPERPRPQLIAVLPATELLRVVDNAGVSQPVSFSADLISEDAGDDLHPVLLVDYGIAGPGGEPWRQALQQTAIEAGTRTEGPRRISFPWTPQTNIVGFGCHTVTLLVTHEPTRENPEFWCPKNPDDVATLTWFTTVCDGSLPESDQCTYDDCPIAGERQYRYCGGAQNGAGGGGPG